MIRFLMTIFVFLAGCTTTPAPLKAGAETLPPYGCIEYANRGGKCLDLGGALQEVLNEAHNQHVYISDWKQYKKLDYWDSNLIGDCEDFALWVRDRLAEMGIASDLVFVIAEEGSGHMVVSVDGWILDNRRRWVMRSDDLDYQWISMGKPSGTWYEIKQD